MYNRENIYRIVITGGGTGGHIYPGIAIADELKAMANNKNIPIEIFWIGSSSGMDKNLVERNLCLVGGSINAFYGIPCGKLRRYLSIKNITDGFKIIAGFIKAFILLRKIKPDVVFSKGGFVSVPPCAASRLLGIKYFTHECDFTPGLATKLNSKGATSIFISYEETKKYFNEKLKMKCVVTGNPVRPIFYIDHSLDGKKYLGISEQHKPILLVLGGSLGARQINKLVIENLEWLKERFIVVHQTGKAFAEENTAIMKSGDDSYMPFEFIYSEMSSVIQASDIILSRAGANSLWESSVCKKPLVLIPLCGSGTRGDQVDNANYFENKGLASVLIGEKSDAEHLKIALETLIQPQERQKVINKYNSLLTNKRPSVIISELIINSLIK